MERRTYRSLTGELARLERGPGHRSGRKPLTCCLYVRPLVQHRERHGAGVATLEAYKDEGIFERVRENEGHFEEVLHGCRDLPRVKDVRNMGLMGAVELEPLAGSPGKRGFEAMIACYEAGLHIAGQARQCQGSARNRQAVRLSGSHLLGGKAAPLKAARASLCFSTHCRRDPIIFASEIVDVTIH
jgi:hypothetical protein